MFGLEVTPGTVEAIRSVGTVFVEALALYVGYGALTRAAGPILRDAVGAE